MDDIQDQFSGTMNVRDQHRFDEGRLQDYLKAELGSFDGDITVEQFKGGQSNPTYKVTAGDRAYVLRRKPPGELLPSAHAVDREYRVIAALQDTPVPVPRAYLLCQDEAVIGTAFYLMEWLDGVVYWDQTLPEKSAGERTAIYREMNRVIADLHMVDHQAVGLGSFGKEGQYIERQIHRWSKGYRLSQTQEIPEMDRLIDWLPENIPGPDETSLVHGDYRMDNMIFHPRKPRVLGVLDWELSTLGHPLADFTYHLMAWRLEGGHFRGIGDADLAALSIPGEDEYVRMYCERTGRENIPNIDFYLAYNMFRLASILQGIAKRAIDGTAASEHAVAQGERAKPMAELAWKQIEAIAG